MMFSMASLLMILGDYTDTFWFPDAASSFAADNDWMYMGIMWVCVLFFVPIVWCLFHFAIKYSKPKGEKAESQVAHNTVIELAWSILPSFFLVWMFVHGSWVYLDYRTPPEGANEIGVQAFKWGWTVDYGGGVFHPELHLLLDEPVKLTMRSSDVIHSLFVPAFRAKKDIVPGRYNYIWFKPTMASEKVSDEELAEVTKKFEEGRKNGTIESWDFDEWQMTPDGYRFYDLYCTEYCGKDHSQMQTVVVVHETREELDAWIKKYSARPDGESPASYGEKLYSRRGCKGCHSVDGSKRVGPSFKDTLKSHPLADGGVVNGDPNYIRESIINPKAKIVAGYAPVMPSYKGQLSDDDIESIIAYIQSIADQPSGGSDVGNE